MLDRWPTTPEEDKEQTCSARVVNRARAFWVGSGSGRAWAWIFKNCQASIGPEAREKSRFSVSDMVFAIAGIKQREQLA